MGDVLLFLLMWPLSLLFMGVVFRVMETIEREIIEEHERKKAPALPAPPAAPRPDHVGEVLEYLRTHPIGD